MRSLASLALILASSAVLAACSFPKDGVPLSDDDGDDAAVIDAEVPPDACVPATEVCDGVDNDCDGDIDEDLTSGTACDGPDADLCLDDHTVCDADGNEVCGDTSGGDNPELCNTLDDDCDGNFDEGFVLNAPCDGSDGDACNEGTTGCSGDGLATVCSNQTDTILETCNHADDDCDTSTDEGFDFTSDEANCGDCGVSCTNANGSTSCLSSTCTPVCNNGAVECNGDVDDGCELVDTNPTCVGTSASADITVNGDAASSGSLSATTERFVRIHLVESQTGNGIAITGRIALTSGSGTDWDLYVYCPGNCGATPMSAANDTIEIGRDDATGDRSYDVIAEVRYDPTTPSTTCASWTLTVTGNVTTTNRCAN